MKLHAKQTFCFFMSILCLRVAAKRYAPEVQTKLGALRGLQLDVKGTDSKVDTFLGVPFAKPPVGPSLRLRAPQPVEGWEGVRDATKRPFMCIQGKTIVAALYAKIEGVHVDFPDISEDCLYLNIYTPAKRPQNAKLPVMVWIHGGAFITGSASNYDGSVLTAYEDVVVVMIQYRLGLLGFLSTGDENMPGNFGMLDQIQALTWIKEHIHNFGGNPDLVTIFGESAGGISVSLLLLSPLSEGLFQRAIAESGTAIDGAVDPLSTTQMFAKEHNCNIECTEKLSECMRHLDQESIVAIAENKSTGFTHNIDGHFLNKPVAESFANNDFLTIPYLTGVNNHEGGWTLFDSFAPPNWEKGLDWEQVVSMLSIFFPDPKDTIVRELVALEYGAGMDRTKNRDAITHAFGDLLFTIPTIKNSNAQAEAGANVYLYEFHHAPSFLIRHRPAFVGSDHEDEVYMVLGYCFCVHPSVKMPDGCSAEEEKFSKIMMRYWANFARTGSPNGDGLPFWPKYGAEEDHMRIDLKVQKSEHGLRKVRFDFFTKYLPMLEQLNQL